MPDDPSLGPFRETFGGTVGTFDEYPTPGYEGITEIVSSRGLWDKWLEGGAENRVDSRAFLKARLFDLVVGNWDRHQAQWRWAHLPGRTPWVPLPEDADQAFTIYEGTAIAIARTVQPRLMRWDGKYPKSPEGLTDNNADVTRWLLADLEWPVYEETARELVAQMTDAVIDAAMHQMPPEWYAIDGPTLTAKLKQRRDGLPAFARKFYLSIADCVDVRGSDRDDVATVVHQPDGSLDVTLALASPDGSAGEPYFHRRFSPKETHEVRLYLLAGNDRLVTSGRAKGGIALRVLGGPGDDRLDDSVSGHAELWDWEGRNTLSPGKGTFVRDWAWKNPAPEEDRPWVEPRNYGHWTAPLVEAWWEPDQELMFGGGLTRTGWSFRHYPWASLQNLTVLYSTGYQSFRTSYSGQFRLSDSGALGRVDVKASGADDMNYYGMGNETPYVDKSLAKSQQYVFSAFPSLRIQPGPSLEAYAGLEAKYIDPQETGEKLVEQEKPYGWGRFGEVLLRSGIDWDSRGRVMGVTAQRALMAPGASTEEKVSGVHLLLDGFYAPRAWDAVVPFGGFDGSLSGFLGNQKVALALRAGGRKLWGQYPWFEAASIGGSDNVRGFDSNRFRGDSSLYGNAELRLWLGRRSVPLLPVRWGLFSYLESGRVWLEGESSDKWHTGGGVGLMTQLIGVPFVLSSSMAWGDSEKGVSFYVKGGYSF